MNEELETHTKAAIEALDKALRDNFECNQRVLLVRDDQYNALGGLRDETYDTRSGVLAKLMRQRILDAKNGSA